MCLRVVCLASPLAGATVPGQFEQGQCIIALSLGNGELLPELRSSAALVGSMNPAMHPRDVGVHVVLPNELVSRADLALHGQIGAWLVDRPLTHRTNGETYIPQLFLGCTGGIAASRCADERLVVGRFP